MPYSPIRKLAPYADEAKRNGVHVYHLNIGQPDIKTPECALEALKNIDREILEYSPSDGYLSLRTKMVNYYAGYGIYLSPDEIIITASSTFAQRVHSVDGQPAGCKDEATYTRLRDALVAEFEAYIAQQGQAADPHAAADATDPATR